MGGVCSQPSLCSSTVQIRGPYDNEIKSVGNCCGSLLASDMIDCSFSGENNDNIYIPNAISGKFYVLLISNYAGVVQDSVNLTQTLGPGITDCSCVTNGIVLTNIDIFTWSRSGVTPQESVKKDGSGAAFNPLSTINIASDGYSIVFSSVLYANFFA